MKTNLNINVYFGCLSDESKHIGDTFLRMQFSKDKLLKI
jgi:hypothetical protein